jgi:hypothetical protein
VSRGGSSRERAGGAVGGIRCQGGGLMLVTFRGEDGRDIVVDHTAVKQVGREPGGRAWVAWREDGPEKLGWGSVVEESFVEVLRELVAAEEMESVTREAS